MILPEILEANVILKFAVNETTIKELEGTYCGTQIFSENQSMLGIAVKNTLVLIPFDRVISMTCKEISIPNDEEADVAVH